MPTPKTDKKKAPSSNAERVARWYSDPANKAAKHEQQVWTRIRSGSIPQAKTLERYNITLEQINCERDKKGMEQLHNRHDMSQERGLKKSKRGTVTYYSCQPVTEQVLEPVAPEVAVRSYKLPRAAARATKGIASATEEPAVASTSSASSAPSTLLL